MSFAPKQAASSGTASLKRIARIALLIAAVLQSRRALRAGVLPLCLVAALFVAGCGPTQSQTPQVTTSTPTYPPTQTRSDDPQVYAVERVIDGDTVEFAKVSHRSSGSVDKFTVRLIGIDTPERTQCGYREATDHLVELIGDHKVTLKSGAKEDHDRYGRLLRYLAVGDKDLGLAQIKGGYAKARYDSRDGYGPHPREAQYVAADEAVPQRCSSTPTSKAKPSAFYTRCADVPLSLKPLHRGDPGWSDKLDRDGDGKACEA